MSVQVMREDWGLTKPLSTAEHRQKGEFVSTYQFAEAIGGLLGDDDVLATGTSGLAIEIFLLSVPLKPEQDVICNWSLGAMGYGLPTAIGACVGSGRKRTICVEGDGGLQVNVQELETMSRLNLPIKLFVLNNGGYASMRASQMRWFGRTFGADEKSGMTLPPLYRIANAYGLAYTALSGRRGLGPQIKTVFAYPGPILCEVPSPPDEERPPHRSGSSSWSPTPVLR